MPTPEQSEKTAEIRVARIIEQLKTRGVNSDYCPRCGVFDWSVDFLALSGRPTVYHPRKDIIATTPSLTSEIQIGETMPSGFMRLVCIVCKNCGYVIFHDLNVLEK
jgi:predicted nucleic-acid-binding Zn-ribbon protein